MEKRPQFVLAFAMLFVVACDDNGFEAVSEVTKLRTLAIGLEPAELAPGEVGQLQALSVVPDEATELTYLWELCLFNDGPDNRYACSVDPESGETAGLTLPGGANTAIPYDAITAGLGSIDAVCAAFEAFELPDFIEVPDCTRGLPLTVRLTVSDGTEEEIAVREVLLLREADEARNANPPEVEIVVSQRVDGDAVVAETVLAADRATPLALDLSELVDLQLVVDPAVASEAYETATLDGTATEVVQERLVASWYATHGRFDRNRTFYSDALASAVELQANEWNLEKNTAAEVGTEVRLWVVLRDDRGGVSFVERRIEVTAR
jgi:hypothetical protein